MGRATNKFSLIHQIPDDISRRPDAVSPFHLDGSVCMDFLEGIPYLDDVRLREIVDVLPMIPFLSDDNAIEFDSTYDDGVGVCRRE